jgi:hypothetical protein
VVKLLVIREKGGPTARLKDFWKLPGGHVDHKEDLGTVLGLVQNSALEDANGSHGSLESLACV